jgi:hypothetical protein
MVVGGVTQSQLAITMTITQWHSNNQLVTLSGAAYHTHIPTTHTGATMFVVTITRANGHVHNHLVTGARLRGFLALCAEVLHPDETLTFAHATAASTIS